MTFEPSVFWRDLAARNERMLSAEGIGNFKRTVANNYFNWLVIRPSHPNFLFALKDWLRHPTMRPLLTTMGDTGHLHNRHNDRELKLTWMQRQVYRLYVGMLWEMMCREDRLGLRNLVSEPDIGNPIRITRRSHLISQDMANSIVECNMLVGVLSGVARPRVLEVGAGYGRLAHVFAATQKGQYFIADIEPALSVAGTYLSQIFPSVRRVSDLSQAGSASIILLDAKRIQKLPSNFFDAVISISTLPEFTAEQAAFYIAEFQRLSRSYILLKQWNAWRNPADDVLTTIDSYQFGPEWSVLMNRPDPLVPNFFTGIWQKKKPPTLR